SPCTTSTTSTPRSTPSSATSRRTAAPRRGRRSASRSSAACTRAAATPRPARPRRRGRTEGGASVTPPPGPLPEAERGPGAGGRGYETAQRPAGGIGRGDAGDVPGPALPGAGDGPRDTAVGRVFFHFTTSTWSTSTALSSCASTPLASWSGCGTTGTSGLT